MPLTDELDDDELVGAELEEEDLGEEELDAEELDEPGSSKPGPPQLARAKANKPDTPRVLKVERKGLDIEPLPPAV